MRFPLAATLLLTLAGLSGQGTRAEAPRWKIAGGFSMDWDHMKVDVRPLAPGVYFLHASGGNTVALVATEGTLLVDTEFAKAAPKLREALDGIGAGPVRYVISTHYHPDHTGGNAYFLGQGAVLVAQDNVRARLIEGQHSAFWGTFTPAIPVAEAPTVTFATSLTLHFGGEEVTAKHLQPAHTDGDAVVCFKKANVVHMGDMFINGLYPYVDVAAKGTIDGYFPVLDDALARMNDRTRVVPGHGEVTDRRRLQEYRDMLWVIRNRVADLVRQGKTIEEVIAANPSREYDAEWASNRVGPEGIAAMMYQSLTGRGLDWHPGPPR
jgi:cyclase